MKKHTATSDGVYEHLKEQILHLELPPGAAISEIETAEKYNMSRTPVRDAFKRLEREGLLEIRAHIGTFISLIDLNAVSDILYIREVLEYSVLSDLAQIYDKSQDLRIQLILQEQKELLESDMPIDELSRAFIRSDNEFHTALFDAAGKKNVMKFLHYYNSQYERFRTFINFNGKEDLQKLKEQVSYLISSLTVDKISNASYKGENEELIEYYTVGIADYALDRDTQFIFDNTVESTIIPAPQEN